MKFFKKKNTSSDLYDADTEFEFIMESIADKPRLIWYESVQNNKILPDLYPGATYRLDFRVYKITFYLLSICFYYWRDYNQDKISWDAVCYVIKNHNQNPKSMYLILNPNLNAEVC